LVHHGGIGTMVQAILAGISQLIFPGWLDQFDNAQHVGRLGCRVVQKGFGDSSEVMEKLQYLITAPEVERACQSAQARAEPGPEARGHAADIIEQTFLTASSTRMVRRKCASVPVESSGSGCFRIAAYAALLIPFLL
jgi:UDP:flavonoid glycosyltransferase YjiC (YdhE family)